MNTNSEIRSGNKALQYLVEHYQPMNDKVIRLVKFLPDFGNQLYSYAHEEAEKLSDVFHHNLLDRRFADSTQIASRTRQILALCIFDLELCIYFEEVFSYCGDKQLASLLVDSLLYQATGYEASSLTESGIWGEGTHNARGIHKYFLTHQQFKHIPDTKAWVFGKEIAAIHGNSKDLAMTLGGSTFSFAPRLYAKNACTFFLYGTIQTDAQQEAYLAILDEMNKQLMETINNIISPNQSHNSHSIVTTSDLTGLWQGQAHYHKDPCTYQWEVLLLQNDEQIDGIVFIIVNSEPGPLIVKQNISGIMRGTQISFSGVSYCIIQSSGDGWSLDSFNGTINSKRNQITGTLTGWSQGSLQLDKLIT